MRKRITRIMSLVICIALLMTIVSACKPKNGTDYEDFYEFDVSSIQVEQLIGSKQVIAPIVKNLGVVITNPKYMLEIKQEDIDVTSDVYTASTKVFEPVEIGEYTLTFTALKDDNTIAVNKKGEKFVKNLVINVVAMNFEPKAAAGEDITIDNSDIQNPKLIFGASYSTTKTTTSNQYRVTGVSFKGDYKIVYRFKDLASNNNVAEPKILFGIDRTDPLLRDDNIFINIKQGNFGCWFFTDEGGGGAVYGKDWTGTGWKTTTKSVSNYQPITGEHTVAFVRIIEANEDANAHYIIEFDGVPFTYLNIRKNYTDLLRGIWIESEGVSATVSIDSFSNLPKDTEAPVISTDYDTILAGEEFDLMTGVTIEDNSGYGDFANVTFEVKDAEKNPVSLIGSRFTPDTVGDYTVLITASDIKGNSSSKSVTLKADASFGFGTFADSYDTQETITYIPVFVGATEQQKQSMTVSILKDGVDAGVSVTGNYTDGFAFTIANGGTYTMKVTMTSNSGTIEKQKQITVVDLLAAGIEIQTTNVARTGVGNILYYSVNDAEVDKTGESVVQILYGNEVTSAVDVTNTVLTTFTSKTTTEENHLSYKVFRPDLAGNYWMKVSYTNAEERTAEKTHQITVTDNTEWVYGMKLDMGNGNPNKMIVGKNTLILDGIAAGDKSSKYIIDNLNVSANWTLSFKITDLKFTQQGKFFATLGVKPNSETGNWIWDDITVGGNVNDDLWGYETSLYGTGWQTYQWRGVWQNPTDEFCPLDDLGNPIPFREGSEYAQYATGTHEYKIECRTNSETNEVVYLYYIDGRPEARHVLAAEHLNFTTIGCVVLWGENMNGIISDISITQD